MVFQNIGKFINCASKNTFSAILIFLAELILKDGKVNFSQHTGRAEIVLRNNCAKFFLRASILIMCDGEEINPQKFDLKPYVWSYSILHVFYVDSWGGNTLSPS